MSDRSGGGSMLGVLDGTMKG
ncbi:Protein of unknown function [Propionibacterium freudenreichii]|uniref:Uncharacterized protein n=1 Tax=Propionibacterium freudenreichii subsp. freudenreichii TaxID=66712 RepID=A0A068VP76_PROFF|nr:Protein of unknown function [Propionibacterium freudenreichii subsp. freudenreichii]CEG86991.1 Protein of unknown function [Propionibacterium freudenreichii]CEG88839.1 Protein of unknown function [Propionibacterium freudenreichii]CEG91671.1 Protein of unknown function [Propionibacterium freudenreichii]CEG94286.1 Protein of unknown function [Propionibacterium freudenreichii]